jgi:hypothetical protein
MRVVASLSASLPLPAARAHNINMHRDHRDALHYDDAYATTHPC